MLLEPTYAENIIVAVLFNGAWTWYVTEKDLWFLDYTILEKANSDRGLNIEYLVEENERQGIKVLDSQTISIFLDRIRKYLTTKEELNNLMKIEFEERNGSDDLLKFVPAILADFDSKRLYSMFPEPASFEDYVPKGWSGKYQDLTDLIRNEEKYWLDEENENMFLKIKMRG